MLLLDLTVASLPREIVGAGDGLLRPLRKSLCVHVNLPIVAVAGERRVRKCRALPDLQSGARRLGGIVDALQPPDNFFESADLTFVLSTQEIHVFLHFASCSLHLV